MSKLARASRTLVRGFSQCHTFNFSQSAIKNEIGKPLSTLGIQKFFSDTEQNSTWEIKDLVGESREDVIDEEQFGKLMELSGLSISCLNELEKSEMLQSLNDKLRFINKLQSIELPHEPQETNIGVHRLMNDRFQTKLTYDDLVGEISNDRPDPTKGETYSSWDPFKLHRKFERIKYENDDASAADATPLLDIKNKNTENLNSSEQPRDEGSIQYFIVNEGLIKENKQ